MRRSRDWSMLFAFIEHFEEKPSTEWGGGGRREDGSIELPYPRYSEKVEDFTRVFYSMDVADNDYLVTISKNDLTASPECFSAYIEAASKEVLLAMLTYYIRQERFCDGLIASAIQNGDIARILRRLQHLIEEEQGNGK